MQNILKEKLQDKVNELIFIPTSEIKFEPYVRDACKANYCGRYNTTWMCPPAVGEISQLAKEYGKYKTALIFSTVHQIEDSFDIEGMFEGRIQHDKIEALIFDIVAEGGGKMLGAGSCNICEQCSYPYSPCRFPQKAKPSVEACGVDVVTLCKETGLNYINGVNTVTYFSIAFFD